MKQVSRSSKPESKSSYGAGSIGLALLLFGLGFALGRAGKKEGAALVVSNAPRGTESSPPIRLEAPPVRSSVDPPAIRAARDIAQVAGAASISSVEPPQSTWPPEMREHLTAEEIAELNSDELYELNHARRPSYLAGAKGAILGELEVLSSALEAGDAESALTASDNIMRKAVILSLAEQGREEYMEGGVAVDVRSEWPDAMKILHNSWIHEVHRSEFPEFFELMEFQAEFFSKRTADRGGVHEIPESLLSAADDYAAHGLSRFPDIEPLK